MLNYSFFNLLRQSISGHKGWEKTWQSPRLKKNYDVIIIGAGGHGLATAYYLAAKHGINNVAVIEKGWLGGGNSGRNTQVVRSNYFWPQSADFYEHSLNLYERLSGELNFNIMLSQRGILNLAHSHHELESQRRWVNSIQINGIDSEFMNPQEIKKLVPLINLQGRFPVHGGFIQKRGGIARHDAVVWAYARAASRLGVDIIQETEVTDFKITEGRITGVKTSQGQVSADRVCISVAGHTSVLARKAGFRLPITSMALQAMVSEPIKPCLNTVVLSSTIHFYVSQSDRGELVIGGAADLYNSYAQRGGIPVLEDNIAAFLELFPSFSRLRLNRQWAGIVDISPDTTPIMGKTPVKNLYINCGFGTGGYKAIPAGGDTMAHTIAKDKVHPLIQDFSLERFAKGKLVDESAAAGVDH